MESTATRGLPRAVVDDVYWAPVHINVGGLTYTSTLNTLTKYPASKLAKLFNGTLPIAVDPVNRHYFLDINGSIFPQILDFLRYGELVLPDDFSQIHLLRKQAEYFEIGAMVEALDKLTKSNVSVSEAEEVGEKTRQLRKTRRKRKTVRKKKGKSDDEHESENEINDSELLEKNTTKVVEEDGQRAAATVEEKLPQNKSNVVQTAATTVQEKLTSKSNVVMIEVCWTDGQSIDIYSAEELILNNPWPGETVIKLKSNTTNVAVHYNCYESGFMGFSNSNYNLKIFCLLNLINQLINQGYSLTSDAAYDSSNGYHMLLLTKPSQ